MRRHILRQPKTLESLVIPKIGEWIAIRAEKLTYIPDKNEDVLSRQVEEIKNRIHKNIPKIFHDQFVMETLRALAQLMNRIEVISFSGCDKTLSRVIEKIIELLFTTNITELYIDQSHPVLIQIYKTATTKPYMLTNITTLEVDDFKHGVILLLKELHNLKVFTHHKCTNYVLKCLVENCKIIEEVDLSHSRKMKDKSMVILTQLPNLKKVTIYETPVSLKGVKTLLLFCDNIEHIGVDADKNDEDMIANTLKNIEKSRSNAGRKFKLKSFNNASYRSSVCLERIVRMCPNIEKMNIYSYQYPKEYLRPLIDLQHLRILKLHNFSFHSDHLKDILQENLAELWLSGCGIDLSALFTLNEKCPNLESLSLGYNNYFNSSRQITSSGLLNERMQVFPWNKLKTLTLSGDRPAEEELIFLLSNCPNIEYITIEVQIYLTDDILLKVLDVNPMSCLKRLTTWNGELTMSIDRMTRYCKELEVVEHYL